MKICKYKGWVARAIFEIHGKVPVQKNKKMTV